MTNDDRSIRSLPSNAQGVLNEIRARFLGRYPRFTRSGSLGDVGEIEAGLYPCPPGMTVKVMADPPASGHEPSIEWRMNERRPTNELLCYRLLKHIYGRPDPIVVFVDSAQGRGSPYDWGWTVCAGAELIEIRRRSHSVFVILWAGAGRDHEIAAKTCGDFLEEFERALSRARFLFEPKTDTACVSTVGFANTYLEKYSAGEELMRLGAEHDQPTEWTRHRVDERVTVSATGTLYQSAILMFFIALEAFEAIMRDFLARPEFTTQEQVMRIAGMPIEERLRKLHVHCRGFRGVPEFSHPEKRLRVLRRVRNNIVHGNSTERQRIYSIPEDAFIFMYAPEQDDYVADTDAHVPIGRAVVRRVHAAYVKRVVDDVVTAVFNALDDVHVHIGSMVRTEFLLTMER